MYHAVASRVTVAIAVVLIAIAVAFAWARSGARETLAEPAAPQEAPTRVLGRSVYAEECGFCHGNRAADRASLARLTDDLYRAHGGAALAEFLLFGGDPSGAETLDHPPFDGTGDEQIAALLEYLLAYGPSDETAGGRPSISPEDIAARRGRDRR